jgi:hypothetical protein
LVVDWVEERGKQQALPGGAVLKRVYGTGAASHLSEATLAVIGTPQEPRPTGEVGRTVAFFQGAYLKGGGRWWDRTTDPYDVNVVLSR